MMDKKTEQEITLIRTANGVVDRLSEAIGDYPDYGIEAEVLIDGEWNRLTDIETSDARTVEAARLFDSTGERGEICRSVEEMEREELRWIDAAERDWTPEEN